MTNKIHKKLKVNSCINISKIYQLLNNLNLKNHQKKLKAKNKIIKKIKFQKMNKIYLETLLKKQGIIYNLIFNLSKV